jgi:hypothetical protein
MKLKKKEMDDYLELENAKEEEFNIDDLPALSLRRKRSSSIQISLQ